MNELGFKETDFLQRHNIPLKKFLRAREILKDTSSDIMPSKVHAFIMQVIDAVHEEAWKLIQESDEPIDPETAVDYVFKSLLGRGGSQQDSVLHEP